MSPVWASKNKAAMFKRAKRGIKPSFKSVENGRSAMLSFELDAAVHMQVYKETQVVTRGVARQF